MLKHNKKRNIGLLNEFFARYMAAAAVEFRFKDYEKADFLWKKHFHKSSELSKELKLFEAIGNARLKDRMIAHQMLTEAKKFAGRLSQDKLDKEKTTLLHEINSELNDSNFFDRAVDAEQYRTNASIQILLNAWRSKNESPNFSKISHVKEKVVDHMTERREPLPPIDSALLSNTQEDIDQLVINVFCEKVDERYSNQLNEEQKEILGLFVFSEQSESSQRRLTESLSKLRSSVSSALKVELGKLHEDKSAKSSTKNKLQEVQKCLDNPAYDVEQLSNNTISFYLGIAGLRHELESK